MKTWEKILLYPIGLYLWLTDGIKNASQKWKPAMAMLMTMVMLCGMLPATVFAAGWDDVSDGGLGFHYGAGGFMIITTPTTEGYYTYGTASADTVTETAANASTLPDSGWQWAVKKEEHGYRMILSDFRVSYSGYSDGLMFDCPLILELRGNNSLTSGRATGSMVSGDYDNENELTILGSGSLTLTGGNFGFNVDNDINVTGGTITVSVSMYAVRSGSLKLGNAMTAQVSNNADGSNSVPLNSQNVFKKYLKIEKAPTYTVTFDKNGGTGTMEAATDVLSEYTLPACTFTAPANKAFKAWSVGGEEKQPGDKITVSANTTVTAVWQDLVKYDLWVGGVQVTNTNASNITGEGITGAVSYDSTTKTLTLNNATITGAHEFSIFDDVSGIYGKETLKINLIGNNTITGSDNGGSSYGIYIDGNGSLTFTGTGSLTVSAADLSENNWSVAVFADGSITVGESCTITAYCGTNAWVASAFKSYAGSNAYNLPNATGILVAGNKNAPEATNFEVCNGDPNRFQYLRIAPGYTVTLNKDGGTINSGNVTCYFVDTGATLPTEVTKANSIFGGWYDNAECTGTAITEIPVGSTGEKEYWAQWTTAHTCSIEPVEKVWPDCENGGKEAYYKCEGCGKFFEDANGTTEIANIETWGNLPKNGHTEGTAWEKDGTHHWHICSVAGCGAVIDSSKGEHTSTGTNVATCQSKALCDDCGTTYGDFAGHDWNTASWEKDATGHWHKCNTAGCTEKNAFAAHTPDRAEATETDPVKCSVCGYEITAALGHTHAHGTEWKSDKDNHWNACACGDKANAAAHKDENADGKCDVCAYNVGLPTPPAGSDNPQTGDNAQLGLCLALLIVSGFGLVAVVFFHKKKYV